MEIKMELILCKAHLKSVLRYALKQNGVKEIRITKDIPTVSCDYTYSTKISQIIYQNAQCDELADFRCEIIAHNKGGGGK